jgi:hypothetical protein
LRQLSAPLAHYISAQEAPEEALVSAFLMILQESNELKDLASSHLRERAKK